MRSFALTLVLALACIASLTQWIIHRSHAALLSDAAWQQWPAGQVFAIPTYDAYFFKHALAAAHAPAAIAVIGSSHLNLVRSQALPGALNLSMSGSGLEYLVSVWQDLLALDKRPAVVLLGADPFMINAHQIPDSFWARDNGRLLAFVLHSSLSPRQKAAWAWQDLGDRFHRFFASHLGWYDLRRAVWILRTKAPMGLVPLSAILADPVREAFLPDGCTVLQGWDQARPAAAGDQGSRDSQAHLDSRYERWEPSPRRQALLQALLADMHAHGTQVWFLGTPEDDATRLYHQRRYPRAYAEFTALLQGLQAQGLIDKLSLQWDRASSGCGEQEFMDGDHANVGCIDKALRTLR